MKYALIAAVNAYPAPYALRGCINDALDARTTLAAKGFSCGMLLDALATKANVLANLNYLVDIAQPGDTLAFIWSGHGSQAQDTNGDEADGLDEVLCTYDYFQGRYIKDDDLRGIYGRLRPGVKLTNAFDCCHAGTGTREWLGANELKPKSIPYMGKAGKVRQFVPTELNHILCAACAAPQLSREIKIGGKYRGAFSVYFWSCVRANFPTIAQTMQVTSDKIALIIPDQTPQLECTEAASLQPVFA